MLIIPFPVCAYAAISYKKEDEEFWLSFISIIQCGKQTNRKWNMQRYKLARMADRSCRVCVRENIYWQDCGTDISKLRD